MADNDRGQSLITKYVWVIETIYRRRKISFKELNELWLRDDISRGVDIPKRVVKNSGNAACKDKRQRLEKGMFIETSTV